jgi:hypothetical protein
MGRADALLPDGAGDLEVRVLTKTWCGQLSLIMTAYEPSLSVNTRLTVPPGYLASAAALTLFAAAPGMIVPVPGRQFFGI